MKKYFLLILALGVANVMKAQYVYTIKADSVKITNNCDTAELILENHTQNVLGFLYNKGQGRTEFRRAIKLNDSTLIFGNDTLVIRGSYNPWKIEGNTGTNPTNHFVGNIDSQALVFRTNNQSRMRVHANGNIAIATATDNGHKLHVNGTTWLGNDLNISHPTFTTSNGGSIKWVANNTFRISGGPQETLTFGPGNAITSNSFFVSPQMYANSSNGSNYFVPGAGGGFTTANTPANVNSTIFRFTCVQPAINSGNGSPTLVEINKPVNRGDNDGLETALKIRFSVTGVANNIRALETVNGMVKLNTSNGLTSIGLDSASAASAQLDVNGVLGYNQFRLRKTYTPSGTSDTNGNSGDVSWDDSYLYMKTSAGWKRVAWSTF